jgi:hypothetical protein
MSAHRLPDIDYEWTPELAYVVGLLTTDGNLSKNGKTITMRSSDIQLLQEFLKCILFLNSPAKIAQSHNDGYAVKPSYRVQVSRTQFYRWLMKIGLMPRKSLIIGALDIPNKYFRDFLRGHLDGDGSIYTYEDKYNHYKGKTYLNTRIYTKFISGSKKHIEWLYEKIAKLVKIKGALLHNKRTRMSEIKYAKYESIKLFKWLYYKKNLPTLMRKRIKAETILNSVVNGKVITMTP